ncbi:MAG: hypothetical protein AAB610_03110 [Patescibacteria group bacterium]
MNLKEAIKILKKSLKEKQPTTFGSRWVQMEAPSAYRYIWKYIRTENNDVNWDRVTLRLDRKFQKRWTSNRRRSLKEYENQEEVDLILLKHRSKLYTLLVPNNPKEERDQEKIIVALVRISQKGNILAQQELIKWLKFIVDEWIDRRWQIYRWKGYTDELEERMRGCIRLYKYTGTFLGYLFKTLEYSARGMAPLVKYSLDDTVYDGGETKINFVIHDQETI